MKHNVILTGMPGSGKSTIGRGLALELNREFIDTDDVIEQQQGVSLERILKYCTSEYFQEAEYSAALTIGKHALIVATGGSMALHEPSMTHLRSTGSVVFLDTDIEQVQQRLGPRRLDRIVGLDESGLIGLEAHRRPFYEATCDTVVKLAGIDREEDFHKVFTVVQDII